VATILTLALVVLDYVFVAPNTPRQAGRTERAGRVLHRKITNHPLLVSRGVLPERAAVRPTGISATRARGIMPRRRTLRRHFWSAAPPTPEILPARHRKRGCQTHLAGRRAVAVPADRGQLIRNVPVLGAIDDFEDVVRDFEGARQADRRAS